jgi:hypothetical protein
MGAGGLNYRVRNGIIEPSDILIHLANTRAIQKLIQDQE